MFLVRVRARCIVVPTRAALWQTSTTMTSTSTGMSTTTSLEEADDALFDMDQQSLTVVQRLRVPLPLATQRVLEFNQFLGMTFVRTIGPNGFGTLVYEPTVETRQRQIQRNNVQAWRDQMLRGMRLLQGGQSQVPLVFTEPSSSQEDRPVLRSTHDAEVLAMTGSSGACDRLAFQQLVSQFSDATDVAAWQAEFRRIYNGLPMIDSGSQVHAEASVPVTDRFTYPTPIRWLPENVQPQHRMNTDRLHPTRTAMLERQYHIGLEQGWVCRIGQPPPLPVGGLMNLYNFHRINDNTFSTTDSITLQLHPMRLGTIVEFYGNDRMTITIDCIDKITRSWITYFARIQQWTEIDDSILKGNLAGNLKPHDEEMLISKRSSPVFGTAPPVGWLGYAAESTYGYGSSLDDNSKHAQWISKSGKYRVYHLSRSRSTTLFTALHLTFASRKLYEGTDEVGVGHPTSSASRVTRIAVAWLLFSEGGVTALDVLGRKLWGISASRSFKESIPSRFRIDSDGVECPPSHIRAKTQQIRRI